MSRILIAAATAVFFVAQMPGAAHAVTYNLTLTETFGPESGTGTFTVSGPITSGLQNFTSAGGGGLSSLSFVIDHSTFTLGNALTTSSATFFNGHLVSLFYLGHLDGFKLTLDTLGLGYAYDDDFNGRHDSVGTISASVATISNELATPLPSTWTMMLVGLAGFGFLLYRRKRPDTARGMVTA